jgi:hypothetical protein
VAELDDRDHGPRAGLAALTLNQPLPQGIEAGGPPSRLPPLLQCRGSCQGAGFALEHIEIVLQVQDLLAS